MSKIYCLIKKYNENDAMYGIKVSFQQSYYMLTTYISYTYYYLCYLCWIFLCLGCVSKAIAKADVGGTIKEECRQKGL